MPKFTPLRERVLVATATKNTAEIARIKREIISARRVAGSIIGAAERLGVNQLTLRRIAADLEIETDLGIDRARGEPDLLAASARIAVRKGDQKAIESLRKRIIDAMDAAGHRGFDAVAASLGASEWALRKTIDLLGMSEEDGVRLQGRHSLIGERVRVAQRTRNRKELRLIRTEILDTFRVLESDIDKTAEMLGITPQTLNKIAASIGLSEELGFSEKREPSILLARIRAAYASDDEKKLDAIEREIMTELKRCGGSIKDTAAAFDTSTNTLRQAMRELVIAEKVLKKFPGRGKPKLLTVRIGGKDVTHSVAEWSRLRGIKRTTILMRLRNGFSPEQALSPGDLRER